MYILLGKITNTHGIKGEVKIKSDFKEKDVVFKKGNIIYIGDDLKKFEINSYRVHQVYDMLTFKGVNDINDVLVYKGMNVYINKDDVKLKYPVLEEYLDCDVYEEDKYIGKVCDVVKEKHYDLLKIENKDKYYYVPNIEEFIKKYDFTNKKIIIKYMKGLIDEN